MGRVARLALPVVNDCPVAKGNPSPARTIHACVYIANYGWQRVQKLFAFVTSAVGRPREMTTQP